MIEQSCVLDVEHRTTFHRHVAHQAGPLCALKRNPMIVIVIGTWTSGVPGETVCWFESAVHLQLRIQSCGTGRVYTHSRAVLEDVLAETEWGSRHWHLGKGASRCLPGASLPLFGNGLKSPALQPDRDAHHSIGQFGKGVCGRELKAGSECLACWAMLPALTIHHRFSVTTFERI